VSYFRTEWFKNEFECTSVHKHVEMFLMPLVDQSQNLVGVWLLSAIIFTTLYKCRLVSLLVNAPLDFPPTTFKELMDSPENYRILFGGYDNTSMIAVDFNASGTELATRLLGRITNTKPIGSTFPAVSFISSTIK